MRHGVTPQPREDLEQVLFWILCLVLISDLVPGRYWVGLLLALILFWGLIRLLDLLHTFWTRGRL